MCLRMQVHGFVCIRGIMETNPQEYGVRNCVENEKLMIKQVVTCYDASGYSQFKSYGTVGFKEKKRNKKAAGQVGV